MENILKCVNDFFSNILSEVFSWILNAVVWILTTVMSVFGGSLSAWLVGQGFSLEIPDEVFNVLNELTYAVGYILPLYAMLPIVWFMLTFYTAKIAISVFKYVTSFLSFGLK